MNGKLPEGARGTMFPNFIQRYRTPGGEKAVVEYHKIAEKHGITITEMSLAFINQLPFVTSNIIGATNMIQLKENIGSINIELSNQIIGEINAVHDLFPNPAA
jgi:aryl-alcohol dehydrogenase-like predicted oxidoreductase